MDKDHGRQDHDRQEREAQGRTMSRRRFLAICAGAVVLAGGGWVLSRTDLAERLAKHALGAAHGRPVLRDLRQVIASDNAHARTIMWQSDVKWSDAVVEYRRKGEKDVESSPAARESFTDDGVTVELYTARLCGLEAGQPYEYRIKADGQCDDWHALQTDDGGAFSALIFPDSQSNDYTDWKHLAQGAAEHNEGADFFINMGDLVDNGEDHRQWEAWFDAVAGIIALDTQTEEAADFHQGLLEAQQAWFREDVKKTDKTWKIVLMHKDPLQYRITNRPDRKEGFSDERRAWMPLFDEAGIDVVFSAHLHTYRNRGHIKNFQRDASGPLYILTGVAGNVRYPGLWVDHALDKVIAPQPETDNYLTLCVKDASVEIACFLPDGTEIDRETLRK